MGNHHDSIALDWVRGEIQDTLTQGQHALEAYVENRDDTARLRFCLNYLHQVHGTLKMVELYGAALLTEEMEKLTQAVLNNSVASVDEAVNVLMQAILQLPQYLEHLTSSQDDFPMVLLPLLNDLRAARGDSLLSDTSLFKPDLGPSRMQVAGNVSQRLQDPNVLGHVRKLRQMYQFALAGVIREEDLNAQFAYLQKVIHRLVRLCQKTPRGELWKAAAAFVETLQARANPVNAAVKSLLRELDSEIRRLIDEHGNILAQPAPDALLKHLLYYVARARDLDSEKVRDLRSRYQLEQALPSEDDVDAARNRVSGPGREAIHSVVSALNEELAKLKDQLDLFVRSEMRQNSELEDLLPGLVQVGNTLAVLGLGIPRKVITEQIELVEKLSAQNELVDDGTLMDIAGALLYVEASLAGLDSDRQPERSGNSDDNLPLSQGSRELGEASSALLRESRNTLEQVKSAVINFIASQWDTREIEHVPGLLHSIRGGLSLVPLDRVVSMLASAERYISDVLLSDRHVPDWKQLDTLADAITSIEYYLERLAEGISDNDDILRIAEESLASLGFPVGEEPTWDNEPAQDSTPVVEQTETKTSDEDLLDDEILGIFVEEAEEVLQTIHEFYPRLRQNHDDRAALTEVRRAFHTLKGSGRMVGANSLGELAWSVENLLNRVIDQSIKPNDELFTLIDEVNARIPSLIQEFREGKVAGDVAGLIERAESIATTRRSDDDEQTDTPADVLGEPAPEANPEPDVAAGNDRHDDLIDDEILEIFIEEAGEVLDTIREYLPMLLRQHDDRSALSEVRRAFHTLKGSGRMVGALVVGELAWSVENMLNRVIDGSIFMNDDIASLLDDATGILPSLVSDFEHQNPPSVDPSGLEARATALANGEIPDTSTMPAAETEGAPNAGAMELPETSYDADDGGVDPVLLDIFESETETHLQTLRAFLESAGDKINVSYTDNLSRALHTLKGSAHTAGIAPIAAVIAPLERFIKESRAQNLRADRDVLSLIETACDFLTQGLEQIRREPQASLPGTEAFLEKLEHISSDRLRTYSEYASHDGQQPAPSQLVQLFLNEGLDIVLDADLILEQWADNPQDTGSLRRLNAELAQLTDAATDAGLPDVAALSKALQEVYAAATARSEAPDKQFFSTVGNAHEHLLNMMDQVAAGLAIESGDELVAELEALTQSMSEPEAEAANAFDQEFTDDLEEIDLSFDMDELETAETEKTDAGQQPSSELALPETFDSELDEELAEIFLEEARDLIDSTAEALQNWSESTGNLDILRLLQRDLHTLKGGARLSDIPAVGDLSHELENLFEGLTEQRLSVNDELSDLLFRCHDRLAGMVENMEAKELPRPAPDLISEIRAYMDNTNGSGSRPVTDVAISDENSEAISDEGAIPVPELEEADGPEESDHETYLSHMDPELTGIFLEEAYDLINSTGSALHTWSEDPSNRSVAAELQRDVHTLKGGARMAGVDAIGDLTHVLEDLLEKVAEGQLEASSVMTDLLFACHDRLAQMVEQVATQKPCPPASDLVDQVDAILRGKSLPVAATDRDTAAPLPEVSQTEDSDGELTDIFLDEGHEIHDAISECLDQWREDPQAMDGVTQLQYELHTLKGGARLSDVDPIADLADGWSGALDALISSTGNQKLLLALSDRGLADLKSMLSALEQGNEPVADPELLAAFSSAQDPDVGIRELSKEQTAATDQDMVDPEILEIFLEEAGEIMDQLEHLLDDWRKDPASSHFNQEAQRALHTLKGGARLSQLSALGDRAHSFETRLIELGGKAPDDAQWQSITEHHDGIIALVADVCERFKSGVATQEPLSAVTTGAQSQPEISADQSTSGALAERAPKPVLAKTPAKARNRGADAQRTAAQETIRVSAPLLDDLVNLAGETSITRGRLEQQSSDFGHTLDEMAATIERLREQLRRMEIETETQILFSAEKEHGPDYGDDFDPLEMDRYSSIQQLSRALTESSSDLADLRETLSDRVRDTETLLVQQSRINTELQEGLMKTRMIPFSSMVPRLRRIVRQISGELGKKVEFDVRNAEGEMDRNILERMIAPLEHMLRNAIDHGIESPSERRKNGKAEAGDVTLSLVREGGDVVLRMIDDGAGIPSALIRDKAIRQGLLREDEDLSEREILQFILQPGFSTAQKVTQISGRGVGMDVVASEIKQLGGSLDIESQLGRGTVFTVRLPFTVSVNRALMVSTGEDFYAIPLNTIEGIVRVSTYELEEYYKPDAPMYEYAGQEYRLQYLGSLLNSDHHPKLQGQALPLPVILVRGAEQPMALQVDNLMGSREIVVKSLGPQFSSVRGVSGATILGDGNVVVILDLPAMIRSDILSERQRLADLEKGRESARFEERATVVMVVDDSVTVRKVTSRLLERNGMEVITAKDGLDAVAQLQDHKPDIMLLDIEMPRMDGFEVASFVRHDDNLRDMPICMITSRTGEKHRERALAIGVNEYLGKPFQETELLKTIERLTGKQ
ncbi:chemosensory pili system protein ChpA (sensor histidine kinase/response regulator) [Marinobacter antarcticus]|uniref:Chemotaxis protein CheA n=1 Tax=Marinobacter antarcticus TaxID=564117 RepID=A0A1M6Q9B7_9GAMM|nr:Hpt domain-containing protein [Marinobacter antarcticus]SHK16740.1 chemosensory pili system protein ChpA (sensor histidine kinase/response regulator) [Marinobacter antarcticus]